MVHIWIPVFAENVVLEMLTTSCRATFTNCMNSGLKTSEIIFYIQGLIFPLLSLSAYNSLKSPFFHSCQLLPFERRFPAPCQILLLSLIHLFFQKFLPNVVSWFWLLSGCIWKKILLHSNINIFSPSIIHQILLTRAELQYIWVDSKENKWLVKNKSNILISEVKMSSWIKGKKKQKKNQECRQKSWY